MFKDVQCLTADKIKYKGNLHSHTVNSDGCLTPEESVKLFKEHGYSFLCLSEHDMYTDLCGEFNDEGFIIIPGLEASAILIDSAETKNPIKVHHMHGILGTTAMQEKAAKHFTHKQRLEPPVYIGEWNGAEVSQQLCDTLREYGCIVTYNHPIWSRVTPEEFINLKNVWALEIYNYDTVNESGTGFDSTYWDLMLRADNRIFAFASDDNHNNGLFDDACGGWIAVEAETLEHDAVIEAMLAGRYYSSAGPKIHAWGIKDDVVWVDCDSCQRVNFVAGGFVNAGITVIAEGEAGLTHAEFVLKGNEQYIRVECVDRYGKTAWTNAVYLEKE